MNGIENNAKQEDCKMAKEELKVAFMAMPEEKKAYYDDVYTALVNGGNYGDVVEICDSALEKEEIELLFKLATEMISAENASNTVVNIEEQLLRNCSVVSAVLPQLMACEEVIGQGFVTRSVIDMMFKLDNDKDFEKLMTMLKTTWQHVKNAKYYVEGCKDLSEDEFETLKKIAQKEVTAKVMHAMVLNSKSYWNELQEMFGKDEVEFIKRLFQG